MMHPQLREVVEALRARKLIPYTITNGGLIDAQRVAMAFPSIGVSFDTIDDQFAQQIGRYKLHRVLANLDVLRTMMAPDRIIIHTVDMGQPLGPLKQYLLERGFNRQIVQPLQPKLDYSEKICRTEGGIKRMHV